MDNADKSVKSMDFCQATIKRMASNSFKLKSWFLVLFTALFTFFAQSVKNVNYTITLAELIWLFPMLLFPYLDAFYLRHERIFIGIYGDFVDSINGKETNRMAFDLRPTKSQMGEYSILNIVFSSSVGWFYFPLLIVFQGLIIFHSSANLYRVTHMLIIPAILGAMALVFRKKTRHQKGIES